MPYQIINYNREKAVAYAEKWAFSRNPQYYNYDGLGGDCTNFASQCLFAGSSVMNYTPVLGWFYINGRNKAPAWTGVKYIYQFLIKNKSVAPFGKESTLPEIQVGDFIQLFNGEFFYHTLLVTQKNGSEPSEIYVAAHTIDSFNRPLSTYFYEDFRCIHIEGVRKWV